MERTNLKNSIRSLIVFALVFCINLQADAQKRFYFDASGNKVKSSDAYYYMDIKKSSDRYKVKEFYSSNDKPKLTGTYNSSAALDNGRHGKFVTYHENGNIDYQVRFKNGKEDGDYIAYHENGKEKAKGVFAGGKETGDWVTYHDNGQIASKGKYFAGKYNGDWIWYYEDGTKKKESRYKNGVKDGHYVTYHDNAKVNVECDYQSDSIWGFYTKNWPSGKTAAYGKYYNNKRDSSWTWFHENGNKSCRVNYEKGEFNNGDYYDEDGKEMDKRVREGSLVKLPKYPGGMERFENFLSNRFSEQEIDKKGAKKARYEKSMLFIISLDKTGKVTEVDMVAPNDDQPYADPFNIVNAVKTSMDALPEFTPQRAYNRYVESTVIFIISYNSLNASTLSYGYGGLDD